MVNFIKNLFLTPRLFWALSLVGTLFLLGYFFPAFFSPGLGALLALGGLLIADAVMLFAVAGQVECRREAPGRFSNGDDNAVGLMCRNTLPWPLEIEVIDELPVQFQVRDFSRTFSLPPGSGKTISYTLRPTERGVYRFGAIHSYASGPIGLLQRRFSSPAGQTVKVYPSYIQMRRYELLAISNRLSEAGIKRIRRLGHTMEFDQIREYVRGDDYRTINWKATARRHALMVNHYQDERSQQVYAAINMGRVMKMPFAGLTLLDYAINASLVISNIALLKQDKAGIITFSNRLNSLVEAQRRPGQMNRIL
ncbi:MAG TPA: DUF58 domain-containing protein, partial [Calditrichia bacterium]|nr:DUF58 domain-containing protein [Calditrichia bacterium]